MFEHAYAADSFFCMGNFCDALFCTKVVILNVYFECVTVGLQILECVLCRVSSV